MGINSSNLFGYIMQWEAGELVEEKDIVELFQYIYDNKLHMSLQGSYGRYLEAMIEAGLIKTA